MAASSHRPSKSRRKNWQYSIVELNSSHYEGIDVFQCVGDHVEVINVKPALHTYSEEAPNNLPKEPTGISPDSAANNVQYENLQHIISDFYNNCQPTELPGYQEEPEPNKKGIIILSFMYQTKPTGKTNGTNPLMI